MLASFVPASLVLASFFLPSLNPLAITEAETAESCAFPTAGGFEAAGGSFANRCAGVLIHPRVVVTYIECAGAAFNFELGESEDERVPLAEAPFGQETCATLPLTPLAVCVLETPAYDVPVTPPVFGCESGILANGTEVTMVGFGDPQVAGAGDKNWARAVIDGIGEESFAVEGEQAATSCGNADLGGPVYVEYPDGSWHVAGIIATSASCEPRPSVYRLDNALSRLEAVIADLPGGQDVDLTPCHDDDGTWAPTEACVGFSTAGPQGGGGVWMNRCAETPLAGPSATCGAPFGVDEDQGVTIEAPSDGTEVEVGEAIPIRFQTNFEVSDVALLVDGEEAGADATWPYGFDALEFPEGTYTLTAVATGLDGTQAESATVTIVVAEPAEESDGGSSSGGPEPEPSESTGETADDVPMEGTGSSGGPMGDAPQSSGGCSLPGPGAPWSCVFLVLSMAAVRRRRGVVQRI